MDKKSRNLIRLAIYAAGGPSRVAEQFGVGQRTVSTWWTRLSIPPEAIAALCEAGGNAITAEQVRTYVTTKLEERATERIRRRFMVDAALGRR